MKNAKTSDKVKTGGEYVILPTAIMQKNAVID